MKFVISLLLLSSNLKAAPIRIFFEKESVTAEAIREHLITSYHLPAELMKLYRVENCDAIKEGGKLDLCLNENGDLILVSVDREFVNESLRIFRAP